MILDNGDSEDRKLLHFIVSVRKKITSWNYNTLSLISYLDRSPEPAAHSFWNLAILNHVLL